MFQKKTLARGRGFALRLLPSTGWRGSSHTLACRSRVTTANRSRWRTSAPSEAEPHLAADAVAFHVSERLVKSLVTAAKTAALDASASLPSKSAAIRKVVPLDNR